MRGRCGGKHFLDGNTIRVSKARNECKCTEYRITSDGGQQNHGIIAYDAISQEIIINENTSLKIFKGQSGANIYNEYQKTSLPQIKYYEVYQNIGTNGDIVHAELNGIALAQRVLIASNKSKTYSVTFESDSQVCVNLITGKFHLKVDSPYFQLIKHIQQNFLMFHEWELEWIPREFNEAADTTTHKADYMQSEAPIIVTKYKPIW